MINHFVLDLNHEIRGTDPEYSQQVLPMGEMHLLDAYFSIENDHNEAVACQLQGKCKEGKVWRNIGNAVTVAASANGVPGVPASAMYTSEMWDVVRLEYTAADVPVSGSLLCSVVGHING
jgi:hypothetical protein